MCKDHDLYISETQQAIKIIFSLNKWWCVYLIGLWKNLKLSPKLFAETNERQIYMIYTDFDSNL